MKKTKRQETERRNTPEESGERREMRIYSCRYPSFTIGRSIKFEAGFFTTEDPLLQRALQDHERTGDNGVRDVTDVLRFAVRKMPAGAKVYLSEQPELVIHADHVRFDHDGLFFTSAPYPLQLVGESYAFRSGLVRQVPECVLQLAAQLAKSDTLKAAAGAA